MARDRSDDPLLDADDVMWWAALGLPVSLATAVGLGVGVPWWGLVLVAVALGLVMRPLRRRYARRVDLRRPSRRGSTDA